MVLCLSTYNNGSDSFLCFILFYIWTYLSSNFLHQKHQILTLNSVLELDNEFELFINQLAGQFILKQKRKFETRLLSVTGGLLPLSNSANQNAGFVIVH